MAYVTMLSDEIERSSVMNKNVQSLSELYKIFINIKYFIAFEIGSIEILNFAISTLFFTSIIELTHRRDF